MFTEENDLTDKLAPDEEKACVGVCGTSGH